MEQLEGKPKISALAEILVGKEDRNLGPPMARMVLQSVVAQYKVWSTSCRYCAFSSANSRLSTSSSNTMATNHMAGNPIPCV